MELHVILHYCFIAPDADCKQQHFFLFSFFFPSAATWNKRNRVALLLDYSLVIGIRSKISRRVASDAAIRSQQQSQGTQKGRLSATTMWSRRRQASVLKKKKEKALYTRYFVSCARFTRQILLWALIQWKARDKNEIAKNEKHIRHFQMISFVWSIIKV